MNILLVLEQITMWLTALSIRFKTKLSKTAISTKPQNVGFCLLQKWKKEEEKKSEKKKEKSMVA